MAEHLELAELVEPLGITLPLRMPNRGRSEAATLHGDFAAEVERLTADRSGKIVKKSRRNGLHTLTIEAFRGEDKIEATHEDADDSYLSGPDYFATLEAPLVIEGLGSELVQRVSWNARQSRDRAHLPPSLDISVSATIGTPKDPEAGILPNLPILAALGVPDDPSEELRLASPYSYREASVRFEVASGPSPVKHRLFGQGVELLKAVDPGMLVPVRVRG